MSQFAGLYIIRSATDKEITLYFDPSFSGKEAEVLGKRTTEPSKWYFTPTVGNAFYVEAVHPPAATLLFVKDGKAFVTAYGDRTPFSIERAGDNQWRFHIPNENEVLRLEKPDTQIKTDREDGSANELWYLERS